MDDGDSKRDKKTKKQRNQTIFVERYVSDAGTFFQSIWVRCRTIFPHITDRKFMESQFRVVLYCGIFLWVVHLLFQTFK